MLETLLQNEAKKISKQYKIEEKDAFGLLKKKLENTASLEQKLKATDGERNITRLNEYKNFIKDAKKDIYYALRTYRSNANNTQELIQKLQELIDKKKYEKCKELFSELALEHISTKERLPYMGKFTQHLKVLLKHPQDILDIGGGLFPLIFPFGEIESLKDFIWVDKDKEAFKVLTIYEKFLKHIYPDIKFDLYNEDISQAVWEKYLPQGKVTFDLALMIKLIPVLKRREKSLIEKLLKVPAKQILVTASKEAMTKHESIYHREKQILMGFIAASGRKIIGQLDIENEFGYLLE